MATNIEVSGRDATVTLPKWLWGSVGTVFLVLISTFFAMVGWGFSYTLETRALTDRNTHEIAYMREWYKAIDAKQTRMEEKLDRLMELVIHYGGRKP